MHNNIPIYFSIINSLNENHIRKLDKKIAIIYRNYEEVNNKKIILKIKMICKESGRKFYLSNDLRLAVNLDLDGVYLPSFNKNLNVAQINTKKKFIKIGSAHNIKEIKIKEKQGVKLIFLSPIFKTKKNKKNLNPTKFNSLALKTKKKIIALGGITYQNQSKLKMLNIVGFAGISYFEKNNNIKI
tara:strand:+ start:61 stop:615 length:555 start_codon:yes stop_codon:yes gene_type:complete